MRKASLTLLAFTSLALAQNQTFTYGYNGISIPVYPDDWNTIAVTTLFVPRSIKISNVTASVQIQFTGVGSLNVYLYSPTGTRTKLLERNCGDLQNIDTTFSDDASSKFSDACPTEAGKGPFRAIEPLSNSRDQNAFGYWRLAVENNGNNNTGLVTGFSITITGASVGGPTIAPNSIVSASSFQSGTVAPGDELAIVGASLGPATGVRADATKVLPTSLGGTTVTFDGVAAPLLYSQDRLVVVQAPTTLTSGATTRVQVATSSGSSTSIQMNVAATNPGIFTTEALGTGQAKVLNQNGSVNGDGVLNSSSSPAAKGTVISVFGTGFGAVTPAIAQGTPPSSTTLSTVNAPVTATIGGQSAEVQFAGAAPGLTGVYQVNVKVPDSLRSGSSKLEIIAGGVSTQDNVTVQIQ